MVINDAAVMNEMIKYIKKALSIEDYFMEIILWEPPRSICLHFIPSLLRRLKTLWSKNGQKYSDNWNENWLMPDFLPKFTGTELFNSGVLVRYRKSGDESASKQEEMEFTSIIREFTPGNISKRMAIESGKFDNYWLIPNEFRVNAGDVENVDFPIEDICAPEFLIEQGKVEYLNENENRVKIKLFKPTEINLTNVEMKDGILDSSNARPVWKRQLIVPDQVE